MQLIRIDFEPSTNSLSLVSLRDGTDEVSGELRLSAPNASNADEVAVRIGRSILALLEKSVGRALFSDWSFGPELDEPKARRIRDLEATASKGDPDALFEVYGIYFGVGLRSADEQMLLRAEEYLNRAAKEGSKRAAEHLKTEWPLIREQSLEHIKRVAGELKT